MMNNSQAKMVGKHFNFHEFLFRFTIMAQISQVMASASQLGLQIATLSPYVVKTKSLESWTGKRKFSNFKSIKQARKARPRIPEQSDPKNRQLGLGQRQRLPRHPDPNPRHQHLVHGPEKVPRHRTSLSKRHGLLHQLVQNTPSARCGYRKGFLSVLQP